MRELLWWMRARYAGSGAAAFSPMPLLDSVTPATGPQGGGTTLTLRGNLLDSASRVLVGGVDCSGVVRQGSQQCQAVTPAGAGVSDITVITLGGQSTKVGAFTYDWSPAQLSLTGWWRAPYAGTPWSGNASAGGSGSNAMNAGSPSTGYPLTPVAPSVGVALGGFSPAEFNGTTQFTVSTNFTEVNVPPAGYVVAALFRASSLVLSSVYPNTYDSAGLFADPYGFNFGVDDAGLAVAHFSGGWNQHRLAGVSVSTWTLGQVRYDGTTVRLRLNGGAWSAGIAAASLVTPASTYKSGAGIAALSVTQPFTGRIAEIITAASLTDTDLNNYRSYLNARYGLSL